MHLLREPGVSGEPGDGRGACAPLSGEAGKAGGLQAERWRMSTQGGLQPLRVGAYKGPCGPGRYREATGVFKFSVLQEW